MIIRFDETENPVLGTETTPEPEETQTTAFAVETPDMPEDFGTMSSGMDRAMFFAPFILFIVFGAFFFFMSKLLLSQFGRYKYRVSATVVSKRQNAKYIMCADVEFAYEYEGMSYRSFTRWPVSRLQSEIWLPVGKTVTVHLNPKDPSDIYWGKNVLMRGKRIN